MPEILYRQVNVFSASPCLGNPLAVVCDARGLDEAAMQAFAQWTNLSETCFLLPSTQGDYRVRIFTPAQEIPFAGHPSLGTAHVVRELGRLDPKAKRALQECGAGLVKLEFEEDLVWVCCPPVKQRSAQVPEEEISACLQGLPVEASLVMDLGAVWVVARVADAQALGALRPDMPALAALSLKHRVGGLTLYSPLAGGGVKVRSFAPAYGVNEDPVCGSGNGAVAAHLRACQPSGGPTWRYQASQGAELGRQGLVQVRMDQQEIWIGGQCRSVIQGTLHL